MKWTIGISALLLTSVAAVAVGPSFVDWNKYKEQATTQIAKATGHDVSIDGDVSLAILPTPHISLEKVKVKDPTDKSGAKLLASLDNVDVNVALGPLFSGQVVVNSVSLDAPNINLAKDAEGRFNYMTPELEEMMAKDKEAAPQAESSQFKISFDGINIKDGTFIYADAAQKAPIEVRQINVDLNAGSLNGPFNIDGSVDYAGKPVSFKIKTGEIDTALMSTSLNMSADMNGLAVTYAGVVSGGEKPEAQGEASIKIASLSEFMQKNGGQASVPVKGGLEVDGVVSATADAFDLKNATLRLEGQALKGQISAKMQPMSVDADFKGDSVLDLDQYIKAGAGGGEAQDPLAITQSLPKTLELPVLGDVDVALAVPGVKFKGQVLKNVGFNVQNTDKGFKADINVGDMPGGGPLQAGGAIAFAEKSKSSKTGTEIYSDPSVTFSVKGKSNDLPQMVNAFTGMKNVPLVQGSKVGIFDFAGSMQAGQIALSKGVVNIDEAAYSVSGALKAQAGSPRSLLKATVVADSVDFDSLSGGAKEPSSGSPLDALKTLSFPYDIDVDLTVNDATLQGYDIKGLRAAAAIVPNTLTLKNVGAQNFAGANIAVSGKVGDLKALSGLAIKADVSTSDPYKLAKALKVDTASWPKDLGATKVSVTGSGTLEAMSVYANVNALSADVGVKGQVSNPLTNLSLSDLAVSVKHPNMAQAIQKFAPGAPNYASLAKPMSFKSTVSMNGKTTSLKNIDANLAGASVTGSMSIDGSGSKPSITGALNIGDLVLKTGKSSGGGASSSGGSGSSSSGGKWSKAPMSSAWLHGMNLDLDVKANSIMYETWDMQKPSLTMTLQNGSMNIADLKAGLYDGQISMKGVISSQSADAPMNVDISSSVSNINMGSLAYALTSSNRIQAAGDVSLNFAVKGMGASQHALVNSLNGSADLDGRNVVMKGFDLARMAAALKESNKPLPRIQEVLGAASRQGETKFDTVAGQYVITNGVVNISSMSMDGPSASIASKGSAHLPNWRIDTVHTITLKNTPEVAPFDITIAGPLNNPGNTFGSGLFDTFLRQKIQDKVIEKLPGVLGSDVTDKLQKFGILPQAQKQQAPVESGTEPASGEAVNDNTAPESNLQEQAAPQPKSDEEQAEEAIRGLINGLLR